MSRRNHETFETVTCFCGWLIVITILAYFYLLHGNYEQSLKMRMLVHVHVWTCKPTKLTSHYVLFPFLQVAVVADSLNLPDIANSQPSLHIPGKLIIPRCALFSGSNAVCLHCCQRLSLSMSVLLLVSFLHSSLSGDDYTMLGLGDIVSGYKLWVAVM